MNATEVISVRAFKEAFWHWRMGYATSLAMFIVLINVIFGIAYTRIIKSQRPSLGP
jgi:ABC-type sugar transport system permease subunit